MKSVLDDESQGGDGLPWDFYLYVANTLLGLSMKDFWEITPNHLTKQFILYLEWNAPGALVSEKKVYALDETPFM